MEKEIKRIFANSTLEQVPVFYRFMTEFETGDLGELKVGARFSKCDAHSASAYLNFPSYKPVSNIDILSVFSSKV